MSHNCGDCYYSKKGLLVIENPACLSCQWRTITIKSNFLSKEIVGIPSVEEIEEILSSTGTTQTFKESKESKEEKEVVKAFSIVEHLEDINEIEKKLEGTWEGEVLKNMKHKPNPDIFDIAMKKYYEDGED